jgi:hypothetical protein
VMSGSSSMMRIFAMAWSLSQIGIGKPTRTLPAQKS